MGKMIFALLLAAVSNLQANEDCIDCPSTLSGFAHAQSAFAQLEQIQESTCPVEKTDHVIIGDSQNGATWSTSYFGNFFQKCLAQGKCKVIDGLEVMKNSSLFDASNNTLKRIGVEGTSGCLGANRNDNIHLCGEAAKEYANKVCQILR